MKVCLSWLKDYLDFDFDSSIMMSKLTMAGIEIESYNKFIPSFDGVIFAQIKDINKHPILEKLNVCKVFDGKIESQVVCGASNFKVGDIVAFAPQSSIVNNNKIKFFDFKGVLSEGMLCSEKELGIGFDNSGILIFEEKYEIGKQLKDILNLNEEIIEFGITPNRGDCLSIIGIAREIAASFDKEIYLPKNKFKDYIESTVLNNEKPTFNIEIHDSTLCNYYGGAILDNVTVKKSPFIIRYRLFHSGIRSINNIVDITNYILIEIGQPMHAFDLDKLFSNKIIVRLAKDGEELETLDEVKRQLSNDNLIITDERKAIALAGVMGGQETSVTDSTKRIFFESAFFNPSNIRKTARNLNLSSDSSYRFERGVDPLMIPVALNIAILMSEKYSEANMIETNINLKNFEVPQKTIKFDYKKCNEILGTDISSEVIDACLKKINILKKDCNTFSIPTYRNDVIEEIDLIEEVARIYGYSNISLNKEIIEINFEPNSIEFHTRKKIRDFLTSLELMEVINYSFCSPKEIINIPEFIISQDTPVIKNPLSIEQSCMRNSLFSGLLKNYINSKNYNALDIKLFEVGAIFKNLEVLNDNFTCDDHLGIILGGKISRRTIGEIEREFDFFDIKGIVEALLNILDFEYTLIGFNNSFFSNGIKIVYDKNVIGVFGETSKKIIENFGMKESVFYFELNLSELKYYINKTIKYSPINRLPFIREDMSFIIDKKITHNAILSSMYDMEIPQLEKVEVFDIYTGKNIPENKKSIAYSLTYRDLEKTLTIQEVNELHDKIKSKLQSQFNAEYR